jgi:hypothetical protein
MRVCWDNVPVISREQLAQIAKQAADDAGFDLAGVAAVREEDFPELEAFTEWIDAVMPAK